MAESGGGGVGGGERWRRVTSVQRMRNNSSVYYNEADSEFQQHIPSLYKNIYNNDNNQTLDIYSAYSNPNMLTIFNDTKKYMNSMDI